MLTAYLPDSHFQFLLDASEILLSPSEDGIRSQQIIDLVVARLAQAARLDFGDGQFLCDARASFDWEQANAELLPFIAQVQQQLEPIHHRDADQRLMMVLPLLMGSELVGVLSLIGVVPEIEPLIQPLVRQLAAALHQGALAMENARLLKEAHADRQRFEVTLASIGDAVIAVDLAGKITFINRAAEALTGWSRADALGQGLDTVFQISVGGEPAESPFQKVMATGEVTELAQDTALKHWDGTLIPIDDSSAPILDVQGKIVGMVLTFRDIQAQRRIEKNLQASEARFRVLAENAQDIIYRYRVFPNPGYEYVSPSAALITGYTPEEYYADPAIDLRLVHPEDQPAFANVLRSKGSTSFPIVLRSIRKDGQLIWMEHRFSIQLDEGGNLLYVDGIGRDVTERYQAEIALRNSEARLRAVLENMPVMLVARDHEGYVVVWNREAERVSGYSAEEALLNAEFTEKIYPDPIYRAAAIAQFKKLEGNYRNLEIVMTAKDGRLRTIAWSSISEEFPVPGWASWSVGLDITDHKLAEERALVLQSIAAALSEAITPVQVAEVIAEKGMSVLGSRFVSVAMLSTDGQTIRMLNRTTIPAEIWNLFHRTSLDALVPMAECVRTGQSIWITDYEDYTRRYPMVAVSLDVTGSQSACCLPLVVNKAVVGGLMLSFGEPRAWDADEQRFIETLAVYCAQALERARLYTAEHDARTRAEDAHIIELQARQDAEKANQIKTQFLAMISHELRTPLTSIKGFTSTLLADDVQFDEQSQRRFLSIIDSESDRLIGLIEHLIDLSRLQAGTLSIELRTQPLSAIIESALPTLRMLAPLHPIEVDVPLTLPLVRADAQRLTQVLINLVANAIRFSPANSPIRISAVEDGDFVAVRVSDQGIGIPQESRGVVFEAFRQLARHGKGGAGLGLAICKGVIERHGGQIWVEDTPPPGTTVVFTLVTDPLLKPQSKPKRHGEK